jgi:uncharacterized membrane protein
MRPISIIQAVQVVFVGLIAGAFLGDRMGATFARPELPVSSFVLYQQIVHRNFVVMMPILIFGSVLLGLVWLFLSRRAPQRSEFWMVLIGTAAVVSILIMTRIVNVPINDQLMTWSVDSPPENVRAIWEAWERTHTVRTVVAIGAFLILTSALALRRDTH